MLVESLVTDLSTYKKQETNKQEWFEVAALFRKEKFNGDIIRRYPERFFESHLGLFTDIIDTVFRYDVRVPEQHREEASQDILASLLEGPKHFWEREFANGLTVDSFFDRIRFAGYPFEMHDTVFNRNGKKLDNDGKVANFSEREFTFPYEIGLLSKSLLRSGNLRMSGSAGLETLNEILEMPDLFERLCDGEFMHGLSGYVTAMIPEKGPHHLSADDFIRRADGSRSLKIFNRFLLEELYPGTAPRFRLKSINDLLYIPDFYDIWRQHGGAIDHEVIERLSEETGDFRVRRQVDSRNLKGLRLGLNPAQLSKIIRLNRAILEASYPECPRSTENRYEKIWRFRGNDAVSFVAYMRAVVAREAKDWLKKAFGSFDNSRTAERLGEQAKYLEMLIHRDRLDLSTAMDRMKCRFPALDEASIYTLYETLPPRVEREVISLDDTVEKLDGISTEIDTASLEEYRRDPEEITIKKDLRDKIATLRRDYVETLTAMERRVIAMRFPASEDEECFTLEEIARTLKLSTVTVHRMIKNILDKGLRQKALELADVKGSGAINDAIKRAKILFFGK